MNKLVIVGPHSSGKSCYFYCMMKKMMRGIEGFSIHADFTGFAEIRQNIKKLMDTSLPLNQRFPCYHDEKKYLLSLMRDFETLFEFEWIEIPITNKNDSDFRDKFVDELADADCLFLCVDGEKIQGSIEYLLLNNVLDLTLEKNEHFPPICIMVTKYDKLKPQFRNQDIIIELLKKSFPVLFDFGRQFDKERVISICPVSLGRDLDLGAKMNPKNVEIPICFAIALLNTWYENCIQTLEQEMQRLDDWTIFDGPGSWEAYPIDRNTRKKEIRQEIERLQREGIELEKSLDGIVELLQSVPVFKNGVRIN